jgi:hypothetical protein
VQIEQALVKASTQNLAVWLGLCFLRTKSSISISSSPNKQALSRLAWKKQLHPPCKDCKENLSKKKIAKKKIRKTNSKY